MHCTCVRQSDLPNTTRLFADVLYHPDKTAAFYQHPVRNLEAFQAAARQIEFSAERRGALIDALRVQNPQSAALLAASRVQRGHARVGSRELAKPSGRDLAQPARGAEGATSPEPLRDPGLDL